MKNKIKLSLLAVIGGALGGFLRELVFPLIMGSDYRIIFVSNSIGALVLGFLLIFKSAKQMSLNAFVLFGVGFCGGLTTLSGALVLAHRTYIDGRVVDAGIELFALTGVGLIMVSVGVYIARHLIGKRVL